jgi:parvulin-like peptidyl-prolyl isomerase
MKKLLILLSILVNISQAEIINAIAIVVEGEPITTAEIKAVQTQMGVSRSKAKNMLIDNRLQKSAMKDIVITEDEIDARISKIAKKNNLTLKQMEKELKKQGLSWNKFREQISTSLKKQKFFRVKIAKTIPTPSTDELKIFYKKHSEQFKLPSSITATQYSAKSKKYLIAFLKDGSYKSKIKTGDITYKGSELTPQLMSMFINVPIGGFTEIFNNGSRYVIFKVDGHGEGVVKPFEQVQYKVASAWRKQQQTKTIKEYFKKMRRDATIEVIRQ